MGIQSVYVKKYNRNKIALIGSGNWGGNYVKNLCGLVGDENVIVCDVNKKKLRVISTNYPKVLVTENFEEILDENNIYAAVIATPSDLHYKLGMAILKAGKNVLIEKPIAYSSEQALEMQEYASNENLILMSGHLMLYHPGVVEMSKMVNSGELGEIYYIHSQRKNLGGFRKTENVLWDLGPHDISIILELIDELPVKVSAQGATYIQKDLDYQDVVHLQLQFDSGKIATIHLSWLDPLKERNVTIVGSKKMMVFNDMLLNDKLKLYDKGVENTGDSPMLRHGETTSIQISHAEPLSEMLIHFLDSIKNKNTPKSDGLSAAKVVSVLEAAQISLINDGIKTSISYKDTP